MVRMFVRHRVKNYETWRQHYDAASQMRHAHAFVGRPELRNAMASAGVTEAPAVWVAEEV